jgi:DNA-directed RNA polymerase subunit RPC12/RpoP
MAKRVDAPPCPKCGAKWMWYVRAEAVVGITECMWFDDGQPDYDGGKRILESIKNPNISCMQCGYVWVNDEDGVCTVCSELYDHPNHYWQSDPIAHEFKRL